MKNDIREKNFNLTNNKDWRNTWKGNRKSLKIIRIRKEGRQTLHYNWKSAWNRRKTDAKKKLIKNSS